MRFHCILTAQAMILAGCAAPQGNVVLLPARDGKATAVVVTQAEQSLTLDQPYAAARLTRRGPQPFVATADLVRGQFGAALAALPAPAERFTLYFVEGKDELTDDSKAAVDTVLAAIARRPFPDVLVVGHTDSVGSDAVNDPLSRQRAAVMRQALLARGLPADNISVAGRGKRELVVPTADNVSEPRNRRVEIQVR